LDTELYPSCQVAIGVPYQQHGTVTKVCQYRQYVRR
jgi:hypothetical protein